MFSMVNYCWSALMIMGKIILEGISQTLSGNGNPESAMCLIKFLAFIGASGFYVLYRWLSEPIEGDDYIDMYLLWVYM